MKSGLLRFAAFGLAFLLVAAIAAAWLVPPLLDWSRYRGEIAELVSSNLGRAVTIDGPVSLSLLPEPILTAGRVSVADAEDGVTIGVAELRVRLALGPLISGRVDARELVLRGLDVHLPWPLGPDTLALRPPTWLSSISARVEDGTLSVGHVSATKIDATLGLVPDTGTYAMAGTAEISGQSWHLSTRLNRSPRDGTAGLDLSLDGQGPVQGLGAMFSGQIAADGGLAGRISARGPDLSRLLPAPSVPFRADGRLTLAAGLAVADELSLDISGSPARGAVSLRLSPALRLDVSLAASRIDLDLWLPALLRNQAGRVVAAIPTGIDLSAEAATLAGGTLRRLRGSFDLDPTSVTLRDVAATLPGDAQLTLAGQVRPSRIAPAQAAPGAKRPDPALRFDGSATLAAASLRTTLDWLAATGLGPLASLPDGVLRTADLRAGIAYDGGAAGPPQVVLTDLNGMIDESHLQGGLTVRLAPRLGLSGALDLDRMALDPWLPALPTTPALATLLPRLGKLDLDLQLHTDQASLAGQTLAPAAMDIQLDASHLALRRLDLQTQGTRLILSGALSEAGRISDGKLELASAPEAAAPFLSTWIPALAPLTQRLPRGPLTLNLAAAGPAEALGIKSTLDVGDLHIEAQPTIDLPAGRWSGGLTLRHPGAPRLLDSIGLGGTASWLGDGSLSFAGTITGTGSPLAPTRLSSDGFDVIAGNLRANGSLAFERTAPSGTGTPSTGTPGTSIPKLTGRISAETLPLPWPTPRAPEPLPTDLLAGWQASVKLEAGQVLLGLSPALQKASATIAVSEGALHIDGLNARLEDGGLTGTLALNGASAPPRLEADLALAGAHPPLQLFDLPLDLGGGVLDATAHLAAAGYAPGALLATLSGSMHLAMRNGTLSGVDLTRTGPHLEDADLRAALSGGSTAFDRAELDAILNHGAATLQASTITGAFGTAGISGYLDIAGRTAELRLTVHPAVADPPDLAVRFSGTIDTPTRTPEIADAHRWRAEHPQTAAAPP